MKEAMWPSVGWTACHRPPGTWRDTAARAYLRVQLSIEESHCEAGLLVLSREGSVFLRTLEGPLRGNNQSDNLRGLRVSAHGSQRGTDLDKLKSVLGRELAAG